MNRRIKRDIDGIVLLDKPLDMSSSDAVIKVRGIYKAKKAGHTGALDPKAQGLLPICLGEATKFSSFFLDGNKRYITTAIIGFNSTTQDSEGQLQRVCELKGNELDNLSSILETFVGNIKQTPPIYSAIKVNGKALYKYARAGQEVSIPTREVQIFSIKLLSKQTNSFTIEVSCSKGTYIRTLVEDIGKALGTGAYVSYLKRVYVQGLPESMISLDELDKLAKSLEDNDFTPLDRLLIPLNEALSSIKRVELDFKHARLFANGVNLRLEQIDTTLVENEIYQVYFKDVFLGIAQAKNGHFSAKRLMHNISDYFRQDSRE